MGTGNTPRDSNFTSFTFTDTSNGDAPQGTVTNVQLKIHVAGTSGDGPEYPLTPGDEQWSWNGSVSTIDGIYVAITFLQDGRTKSSGWVNIGWPKELIFGMTTAQVAINAAGKLNATITAQTDPVSVS